jgi:hypothetical protein
MMRTCFAASVLSWIEYLICPNSGATNSICLARAILIKLSMNREWQDRLGRHAGADVQVTWGVCKASAPTATDKAAEEFPRQGA